MKYSLWLSLCLSLLVSSCINWGGKRIKGNGQMGEANRGLSGFTKVRQSGSFDVYLSNGPYAIRIEAEENILPYIETELEGKQLRIRSAEGIRLNTTKPVKIYVSAPEIEEVQSAGSGDIRTESTLTHAEKIRLITTGSADIEAAVNAPTVLAEITGSGNLELSGETRTFKGEITGSGDMEAAQLKAESATVDIKGSGNANVYASVQLSVDVAGSGDVTYRGNASQISSKMRGSGTLKKVN